MNWIIFWIESWVKHYWIEYWMNHFLAKFKHWIESDWVSPTTILQCKQWITWMLYNQLFTDIRSFTKHLLSQVGCHINLINPLRRIRNTIKNCYVTFSNTLMHCLAWFTQMCKSSLCFIPRMMPKALWLKHKYNFMHQWADLSNLQIQSC